MLSLDTTLAFGGLIGMAMAPIYYGSLSSLRRKPEDVELLEAKDAWRFPLIASSALFGLYVLFMLFNKEYINYLFTAYFLLASLLALGATLADHVPALGADRGQLRLLKWTVPVASVVCGAAALPFGLWYAATKHWLANNLFGLAFCLQGVSQISVSFTTGCMLLWALFVYDIFWVFGTPVMVTVATNLDGPIKLLFPKNLLDALLTGADFQQSLLGLGDIVLPGMFLALLLRFDAHQAKLDPAAIDRDRPLPAFPTPYFTCAFAAYFVALATTMGVMVVFHAAQPALLYLVPACTIAPALLALKRGEFSALYNFSEDEKIKSAKKEHEAAATNEAEQNKPKSE